MELVLICAQDLDGASVSQQCSLLEASGKFMLYQFFTPILFSPHPDTP